MQLNMILNKKARGGLEAAFVKEEMVNQMCQIIKTGNQWPDGFIQD